MSGPLVRRLPLIAVLAFAVVAALVALGVQRLPSATTLPATPSPTQPAKHTNTVYGFSVTLPDPYRRSERLTTTFQGDRPAAQDAFTARTPEDEVVSGQRCGDTACAIWNYVAVVEIWPNEASTGTPREWYQRYSFSRGERIQEVIVDGRPTVRIDGGATYPVQYIVRDGIRIFRVAYLIYPPDFGPTPVGASREKLEQILASFRFTS